MTQEMWVCDKCDKEILKTRQGCINSHLKSVHWSDTESHIEQYKRVREQIPKKYVEAFESLSGEGRAIKSIQAAIEYIETSKSQYAVADEYDTTDVTVRETVDRLIETGFVALEKVKDSSVRRGEGEFGSYTNGECRWDTST